MMAGAYVDIPGRPATTFWCVACRRAMRIAPEHLQIAVSCPHCHETVEPWRLPVSLPSPRAGYGDPPQGLNGYSWRNRWVAGVLGVLLGPLGVHRFYLGFVGLGIVQIVVTCLTLGIGGIWGFIEGVLCLAGPVMRDVDGLPLRS
jgi:TM2 domain-containing membrane protein YozV